ncbi:chorismate mutase [Candidatus Peregrinibacteria bacterium]|nr:MAG: chorismate mutase [Candidatus Peregrinibacteria bacterium]
MNELRKQIDLVDQQIVHLMAERFKLSQQIADFKRTQGLSLRDKAREAELIERLVSYGKKEHLSRPFIHKLYERILIEARRLQRSR